LVKKPKAGMPLSGAIFKNVAEQISQPNAQKYYFLQYLKPTFS